MFVWKSGILYGFRRCLYEISVLSTCLHEFRPVGWVVVIMCAATVGLHNLWVADRSASGSGGIVGQKNTARASSSPTCALEDAWQHEHPSHSSFIGGKGTGGQKGRQYFGYPGQDPNSPSQPHPSQHIQICCSLWNFAMCCFHGYFAVWKKIWMDKSVSAVFCQDTIGWPHSSSSVEYY